MTRPDLHPACAAYPPLPPDEQTKLVDDIKHNGLLEAITMYGDTILDGRCRWDACQTAGVKIRTTIYTGDDPIAFVLSKNERRRHLPMVERAFIAEALATLQHGGDRKGIKVVNTILKTKANAARALNVSKNAVAEVRVLNKEAAAHVIELVKAGKVSLQIASRAVRGTPESEQQNWKSAHDIKRAFKAKKNGSGGGTKPKAPEPRKTINRPYLALKLPTPEETGAPPEGSSLADHFAHDNKYGRVSLYPMRVKELLDHEGLTGIFTDAVATLAGPHQPSPEQVIEGLEAMLGWLPQTGKTDGSERDFAKTARARLLRLEKALPITYAKLGELIRLLALRAEPALPR